MTAPPVAAPELYGDGVAAISDREYAQLRQLVLDESGISLGTAKRELLVARLSRRVRELGLESFGAYYEYVVADRSGAELVRMLDRVATNETSFFRERGHFELLATSIFPRWRTEGQAGARPRRVRAWSAACSTGQEPYSLAMLLLDHFPEAEGWTVEVLATDLSTRALRAAAGATWPIAKAAEIPPPMLQRYMLRGTGAQVGQFRATPALRRTVHLERLNLMDPAYPVAGRFDLIFCRNVMIYFTPEGRTQVVSRLVDHLAPGGHLFVGHAESLSSARDRLRSVVPTVYALADGT